MRADFDFITLVAAVAISFVWLATTVDGCVAREDRQHNFRACVERVGNPSLCGFTLQRDNAP